MGMVYVKGHSHFCPTYPWQSKCQSRYLIKRNLFKIGVVLDGKVFNRIISQTFVPEVDLFASRLNAKSDKFISWHPDPGAMAFDAFSVSWSNMSCYAFPPLWFSLLPRMLAQVLNDKALALLIAPVWPTQSWYPLLLQLLIDQPIRLPRQDNLLFLPHSLE